MSIFDIFKKQPNADLTDPVIKEELVNDSTNLFTCHYCNHKFEVTDKMQFPTSVASVDKQYFYQGIGVQCPKCFKDCIYG